MTIKHKSGAKLVSPNIHMHTGSPQRLHSRHAAKTCERTATSPWLLGAWLGAPGCRGTCGGPGPGRVLAVTRGQNRPAFAKLGRDPRRRPQRLCGAMPQVPSQRVAVRHADSVFPSVPGGTPLQVAAGQQSNTIITVGEKTAKLD